MDEIGVAVLSSFLSVAFDTMGTPEYEKFFNSREFDCKQIQELEAKMIALSLMVDDAEEKQFAREDVREWLLELKDATHEAEDLLDWIQIEYQAHQDGSSPPQDPPEQKLGSKFQVILGRFEKLIKNASVDLIKRKTTSSSARPQSFEFEVFLNFRGDDVRYNFLSHLKDALQQKGIKRFYDAEDLRKGDDDLETIFKKIEASKMSIMVFSKDYASSGFCLKELVKILNCKETSGHKALPVFYHVDPHDVANQSGTFAEAFQRHEEKPTLSDDVRTWRAALREAAAIVGQHLDNTRHEKYDIQEIVNAVVKMLKFDKEKTPKDEGEP